MKSSSNISTRKSIRLKEYDYSTDGAYFLTICSYKKKCIFEDSDIGSIVKKIWDLIPEYFPSVILDEFTVMPNHVHGILWIMKILPAENRTQNYRGEPCVHLKERADARSAPTLDKNYRAEASSAPTLGRVVQMFKSKATVEYIDLMKSKERPYLQKIWQRNYYERIIRNEKELYMLREYIKYNPMNWKVYEEDSPI